MLRVAGTSNVGKVRTTNEDALVLEPQRGLYAVLDGMGGANAGDVASATARAAIIEFVAAHGDDMPPKQLVEQAIQHGCAAVHRAAQERTEHNGMGTTCVACLLVDAQHAIVAHVGDSRAYLHRNGRLQILTRDHTIVEELVDRGMLSPDEAERHPYKNVLSRNLGARVDTRVDLLELELKAGDRVMLCSDGLYGYASAEAIQYQLGSDDDPEHVANDLVELALRGGGGDNVSVIVIEAPPAAPSSTQLVRTSGAIGWWQHRQKFMQAARDGGLARNPIVRGLDPDEALELIALNLCEAIFHDLEKSTGVNVWTFAQNLAGGWFERGGGWTALREMVDILANASRVVVDAIRAADGELGFLLDVAVGRALVVAELALGGLLAERLRTMDADLIALQTAMQEADSRGEGPTAEDERDAGIDTGSRFIEQPTVPFLRADRPATVPGTSPEVLDAITKTLTIARARTAPRAELVREVLTALDAIAPDGGPEGLSTATTAARELYGVRPVDEAGIMPLFDALDQARIITTSSVHQIGVPDALRAKTLRAISVGHQRLVTAITTIVLESVAPISERLREVAADTSTLRDEVAAAERRRAELERKHAESIDHSLPWERRGTTEW
jgi:protein phosphatase|nr:PP2C family serine/threonine-protein phosphatase [Kofleriaceae bacterium]